MGVNLILAAGDSKRWKGRTPKQLMKFDGEAIIDRTIRQLDGDVAVVSHNRDILEGIKSRAPWLSYHPSARRWVTETLLSMGWLWRGKKPEIQEKPDYTRVFLGDVIYSDEAIAAILKSRAPLAVFGRKWEIFGLSFSKKEQLQIILTLEQTIDQAKAGDRGKLWEFYWNYIGLPAHIKHGLEDKIFHHITDWTDDIDTLQEYCDFMQKNQPPGLSMSEILRSQVYAGAMA